MSFTAPTVNIGHTARRLAKRLAQTPDYPYSERTFEAALRPCSLVELAEWALEAGDLITAKECALACLGANAYTDRAWAIIRLVGGMR